MAILPSTGDARGRCPASKPLYISDTSRVEGIPHAHSSPSEDSEPLHDHASDQAAQSSESRGFTSDSEFWQQMMSTLDACFSSSNNNEELPFILSDDMLAEAPRIMQTFLSHGDACSKIESKALDLVTDTLAHDGGEPLKAYNEILDDLERLQEKAASLELTISRLASITTDQSEENQSAVELDEKGDKLASSKLVAYSELCRIFAACLPVLRARVANLTMAQDLIDSAQENLSITLRMEYLGID